MFKKLKDAISKTVRFFTTDTYPFIAVNRELNKGEHGLLRGLFFTLITHIGSVWPTLTTMGVFSKIGAVNGAIVGSIIGTLILPGIGTSIGATVGAISGALGGGLIGWKIGLEGWGFIAATIAKQTMRGISALFNANEANPTNPYKYKLTEENTALVKRNAPTNVSPEQAQQQINDDLRHLYQLKKEHVKTSSLLRILGWYPLFGKKKDLNLQINNAARDLKFGDRSRYIGLQTMFSPANKTIPTQSVSYVTSEPSTTRLSK